MLSFTTTANRSLRGLPGTTVCCLPGYCATRAAAANYDFVGSGWCKDSAGNKPPACWKNGVPTRKACKAVCDSLQDACVAYHYGESTLTHRCIAGVGCYEAPRTYFTERCYVIGNNLDFRVAPSIPARLWSCANYGGTDTITKVYSVPGVSCYAKTKGPNKGASSTPCMPHVHCLVSAEPRVSMAYTLWQI